MLAAWLWGWQCQSVSPPLWSTLNISTTVGCIAMKFGADIHDAQRTTPNEMDDPLTFHLAPPADQFFPLILWKIWTSYEWIGNRHSDFSCSTSRLTFCGSEWNVSTTIGRIVMKFGTDINFHIRINCNNFGDPITFHMVPSSGHILISPILWFLTVLAILYYAYIDQPQLYI